MFGVSGVLSIYVLIGGESKASDGINKESRVHKTAFTHIRVTYNCVQMYNPTWDQWFINDVETAETTPGEI